MKEANRFSKPVAFNRSKEADKKILKHVARRNFSGYVKKLILADIAAKGTELTETTTTSIPVNYERIPESIPKTAADRLTEMKNQQKKKTGNISGPKLFH